MKKDIPVYQVTDVSVAIVKELNEHQEWVWNVYLINEKNETIEGVLVTSTGYGVINEEKINTSTLRHFLDVVGPQSYIKIEPIIEDVFSVSNEYWVSFYLNNIMYDKQYVFLPETICESNFVNVPLINKKGVMIK
jgi:hypothetical protein